MTVSIEKSEIAPSRPSWEKPLDGAVPKNGRLWWMSFDKLVEPGETTAIRAQPETDFRGHRLSVDPVIAPHFRVKDIRVGNLCTTINGNSAGAAATLFPPIPDKLSEAERLDYEALLLLDLSRATSSTTVSISVTNTSNEARVFNAVLWGKVENP